MKTIPRSMRATARLVAWTWLCASLLWAAIDARSIPIDAAWTPVETRLEEPPDPTHTFEAVAPPESAASPAPSAVPEPARPVVLGDTAVDVGSELLDGGAPFPALSADYEAFRSFPRYARAMRALGARFLVLRGHEIVGSADIETRELGEPGRLAHLSPRARDYTGEPALASVTQTARERFGSNASIRLLVPRDVDAGLFGGIARGLAERGDSHEHYSELRGRYEPGPNGGVVLRVDTGVRSDGSVASLDLAFDLSGLASTGPGA